MALTQVTGPYPIFTDLDGTPLDDGYLYIGDVNDDPETNPIQVYWDSALTIPATQPIRTSNGYAYRNGTPALIYTAGGFSITIRNKRNEFVLYSPVGYGFDPAATSASVVQNDFTGDGTTVAFTLSASPSTKLATSVFINGVYQEKDSYSVSGNTLTFTVAPPLSSGIEVMTNETGVIGSTNASLVSYTAGFANAVAQTVQTKLEQYVSVDDFAGTEVEKLRRAAAALTLRGGGILGVPNIGTRLLASAELATGVTLTSNITVDLEGSTYEVTGSSITNCIFTSTNTSNVTVKNGTLKGNSQADAYVNGGAFFYTQTAAATSSNRNIRCENLHLQNFKAAYWIYVDNQNETYPLYNVDIEDITWETFSGNLFGSAITFNSAVIGVQSGDFTSVDAALIYNVNIRKCSGDSYYIKSGVVVYNACRNVVLDNIVVLRSGFDPAILNDTGAYAIQLYDKWGNGRGITCTRIDVEGKSCGIYTAGCRDVHIDGVTASGQTDTVDTTLPKGGVVFNGTVNYSLTNSRIASCVKGIQLVGPSLALRTDMVIDNVNVSATAALRIDPSTSVTMSGITFQNCRFVSTGATGADIRISDALNLRIDELTIVNSYFEGATYGFNSYTLNAASASANWNFINTTVKCDTNSGSVGIRLRDISGKIEITGLKSLQAGQAIAAQFYECDNLRLGAGIELTSATGGIGLDARLSSGTITDMIRISVATTLVQAGSLGLTKPTHSGVKGDVVTAIDFTVAPAGAGQVYTNGWLCQGGTVWRPQVATVNAA